jgi:hypothetical protein
VLHINANVAAPYVYGCGRFCKPEAGCQLELKGAMPRRHYDNQPDMLGYNLHAQSIAGMLGYPRAVL